MCILGILAALSTGNGDVLWMVCGRMEGLVGHFMKMIVNELIGSREP